MNFLESLTNIFRNKKIENKLLFYERRGLFISIVFAQNLNREPAWRFCIEDVEEVYFESSRYGSKIKCKLAALEKAKKYYSLYF